MRNNIGSVSHMASIFLCQHSFLFTTTQMFPEYKNDLYDQ